MTNRVSISPVDPARIEDFVDLQIKTYNASLKMRGISDSFMASASGRDEWVDYYSKVFNAFSQDRLFGVKKATVDGNAAGYVVTYSGRYEGFGENTGKIDSLCVHPELWGQGIGKNLVQSALMHFKDEGSMRAVLSVEREDARARKFWGKQGWLLLSEIVESNEIDGRVFPVVTLEKYL